MGVTPFEFCRVLRRQKARVPGLSCGVVCVILPFSVEHRLVTDRQTDRHRTTAYTAIAWRRAVKNAKPAERPFIVSQLVCQTCFTVTTLPIHVVLLAITFTFAICCRPCVCLSYVCRLFVCNARTPYSSGCKFRQFFYAIWYLCYPLTFTKKFTQIVPGEPLRRGS